MPTHNNGQTGLGLALPQDPAGRFRENSASTPVVAAAPQPPAPQAAAAPLAAAPAASLTAKAPASSIPNFEDNPLGAIGMILAKILGTYTGLTVTHILKLPIDGFLRWKRNRGGKQENSDSDDESTRR